MTYYLYTERGFATVRELCEAAIEMARFYPEAIIHSADSAPLPTEPKRIPVGGIRGNQRIVKLSDKVLDNIEHTAAIWQNVPCPRCQAAPGRPCVTPRNRDTGTHGARATLYRRSMDYRCMDCGIGFAEEDQLDWHVVSKHPLTVTAVTDEPAVSDVHPCAYPGCDHRVNFDDEPYCFGHSPDSGSSVRGYSYKASHSPYPAVTLEEM